MFAYERERKIMERGQVWAETISASFLACNQDPFNRKTCGGEAERFYPNQCLKKECCYRNQTCYYHVIDGKTRSFVGNGIVPRLLGYV